MTDGKLVKRVKKSIYSNYNNYLINIGKEVFDMFGKTVYVDIREEDNGNKYVIIYPEKDLEKYGGK